MSDELKEEKGNEETEAIKETPVKQLLTPEQIEEKAKIEEENELLKKAQAIQAERTASFKREEEEVMAQLGVEFGITKEDLEVCKKAETGLANPENKIKTLIDALKYYESLKMKPAQLMFMAINSNSRSNIFANENEQLRSELEAAKGQIDALMQLGKIQAEGKKDSSLKKE
jgi:hypothetical protein